MQMMDNQMKTVMIKKAENKPLQSTRTWEALSIL